MRILFALLLLASLPLGAVDGALTKTPWAMYDVSLDFATRAPNGITLVSVTAYDAADADATSRIITTVPTPAVFPSSKRVIFRVHAGEANETFSIAVRVVKNDTGEKVESVVLLRIAGR